MTVLSERRPTGTIPAGPDPKVDVAHLERVLLGRWRDVRRDARAFLADPRLHRVEGMSCADHRATVLEQLRILAAEGDSRWTFFTGNYQEYEADKRRRLGEEGAKPKRIRYKPITRGA